MRVIVINPKARTVEEQQIPDNEEAAHAKIKELCSADLIQTAGFIIPYPPPDGVRNVMWLNEEAKLNGPVHCFLVDEWGAEPFAGVGVINGIAQGEEGLEHAASTMPLEEIRKRIRFIGEQEIAFDFA